MTTHRSLLLGLPLLLAGCGAEGPTAPEATMLSAAPAGPHGSPLDVAGAWSWIREDHLTFPPFAAEVIFGVRPEGRTTVATCVIRGTLDLVQVGSTATGDEATLEGDCRTLGGQTFSLNPSAHVVAEVVGASLHMTFQGMVTCLVHAAARDVRDGVAGALEGGGRCVIPGHPRSPVPGFEPPPAGTEVITRWTAVRP